MHGPRSARRGDHVVGAPAERRARHRSRLDVPRGQEETSHAHARHIHPTTLPGRWRDHLSAARHRPGQRDRPQRTIAREARHRQRPHAHRPVPRLALHAADGHREAPDGPTRTARARGRSRISSAWTLVPAFSQVCRDELLTLALRRRRPQADAPAVLASSPGVTVTIADFGRTASAPTYEPMYAALEAAGYTRDKDIRVAGYDARLTPDMDGFLQRSKRLIEETYRQNGRPAGPPRRPLQRADLRAVPADPHQRRTGRRSTSTASRRWPATSPARDSATP